LKFTHGDLSSLNIIVRGDTLVGLIDWETAGSIIMGIHNCLPGQPTNSFWANEIDKFLKPMPEELAMDQFRETRFEMFILSCLSQRNLR
jgi:aminoglycoside phosphotransferase